ncbi:alpha/beta hydrolase [Streptomyces sp. Ncost-T10-10d]|uniref:alpha/beta hydrolase n=1 Tax=Streptomyces sp. Ncost-T10-10d TaxID=1839774 RepID=UPI00081F6D7B|nr:TAP-like protein [Streptomyces sp. Ncost-T10-10d]
MRARTLRPVGWLLRILCAYRPTDPVEPQVRISDRGPSNVLMVHNERDPGTPLVAAHRVRQAFGRRTVITADRDGHDVYPYGKNRCVNDAVTGFLTTGERPSHDRARAAWTH